MKEKLTKKYLTPAEVAELFKVSPITVRQWANNGWIQASTTPGGHRRYEFESVLTFAKERNVDLELNKGNERILIVDDEEGVRDTLVDMLEDIDSVEDIGECEDGFSAGLMVHSFNPTTIFLDIVLPGLDGVQVCKALKSDAKTSHIRVFAMSGNASEEMIKEVMSYGAEKFFQKPLDLQQISNEFGV